MKFYSLKLEELRNVRKTEQCNEVTGKEHEPDCEITINDAVVNLQELEDGESEEHRKIQLSKNRTNFCKMRIPNILNPKENLH